MATDCEVIHTSPNFGHARATNKDILIGFASFNGESLFSRTLEEDTWRYFLPCKLASVNAHEESRDATSHADKKIHK